jgi:hypothetical protein
MHSYLIWYRYLKFYLWCNDIQTVYLCCYVKLSFTVNLLLFVVYQLQNLTNICPHIYIYVFDSHSGSTNLRIHEITTFPQTIKIVIHEFKWIHNVMSCSFSCIVVFSVEVDLYRIFIACIKLQEWEVGI